MKTFRLDPLPLPDASTPRPDGPDGLTGAVLLQNAQWFTRIRWIAVAVLACFGTAGILLDPGFLRRFGLLPPGLWPFWLTGMLVLLNWVSIHWVGWLSAQRPCPWRHIAANIWFQIVSDLLVLTVLVYRVGPTNTVIAFSYLFHITLACIFFGRRDSFLVTLLSAVLFLGTVFLQHMELLTDPGILAFEVSGAPGILAFEVPGSPGMLPRTIFAVPVVFVWVVVWYLVSSLSSAVRQRDRELNEANALLTRADEEMNLQMLRVTHDLKAPFSGIESNIQLLKQSHWDETPEPVRQIISKIDGRAGALRARIGDILTLGSLRSTQAAERIIEPVNLHALMGAVIQDIQGLASAKRVTVATAGGDGCVRSDPRQLKILFSNLVSNAIVYSREGGTVDVGVTDEPATVRVRIADHGIGISEKALPHVFEDFYRSQEAAAFNPNSTGLGLAIVRQVARNLRLSIVVESEQGKGTVFQVLIPKG